MQKGKHRVWLLIGVVAAALISLMSTLGACGPTGITLEQAITIARQAVEDDGVMSLDGRDTEHEEEATYWHIYFPFTSPEVLGGEPHVQVAKADGEVLQIYYTQ